MSGRGFTASDAGENSNTALVDQTFVREVMGNRNPVGQRVRQAPEDGKAAGPWLDIVGVVADATTNANKTSDDAFLFRPVMPGAAFPIQLAVHVNGDPAAVTARLRTIAAAVDPTLRVDKIQTLDQVANADRIALAFFVRIGAGIAIIAMMLSMAGVYALMSFTVARRTPEIAIRLALGANAKRVVLATFSRALLQVTLGVVIGCIPGAGIVSMLEPAIINGSPTWIALATCGGVIVFMGTVTIAACFGPARRALRIQPTDALKAT